MPSITIVKIRKPFLATDRGTAIPMAKALRHGECKKSWARTIVVIRSIELDRMLLHSFAISSDNPGMVRTTPSRTTGTPTVVKSKVATIAEPCCRSLIILSSTICGSGTKPNKNPKGTRYTCKARVPKQKTNAPTHQTIAASITSARRTSEVICGDQSFDNPAIAEATPSRSRPTPLRFSRLALEILQSNPINIAAIGRIRSMCVYCSLAHAILNVWINAGHAKTSEGIPIRKNFSAAGILIMYPVCMRPELLSSTNHDLRLDVAISHDARMPESPCEMLCHLNWSCRQRSAVFPALKS